MPRDERAYLADILESCDAIKCAVLNFDLAAYQENRLVRSSVEREFIIIGEAMAALARNAPATFEAITRQIRQGASASAPCSGCRGGLCR